MACLGLALIWSGGTHSQVCAHLTLEYRDPLGNTAPVAGRT